VYSVIENQDRRFNRRKCSRMQHPLW